MTSRKLHIPVLFAMILVALTIAGCYRHTPEQRADRIVSRIAENLDLNDAQKAKLNTIKDEFMAKMPAMRKAREETFSELIADMKDPSIDQGKLTALADKNKAQADEFIGFIFAKYAEFHDMLTPEQRAKAAKEMEEWKGHHGGHHH